MDILTLLDKNKYISSLSVCSLSSLYCKMNDFSKEKVFTLCPNAKTVIFALFPYYFGNIRGNLSKYAMGKDYHLVIKNILSDAINSIKDSYPNNIFIPLVDNSPLPEVYGAYISGCGILGKNGLIFDKKYGSYVFIGSILTDLHLQETKGYKNCLGCNACINACPTGALCNQNSCLSHLTQTNENLSDKNKKFIKASPYIWGCDICSDVCPMNKNVPFSNNPNFTENLITSLTDKDVQNLTRKEFLQKFPERSFTWKGPSPIMRNIRIKTIE